jgi:hypothetical protein
MPLTTYRLTAYGRPHTICVMQDSDIRTIAIRFSVAEHRLLDDLAAAQGVDVETLIREALTFSPIEAHGTPRHLQLVGGEARRAAAVWDRGRAAPSS